MPEQVFPRKFAYVVKQGFDRVKHYRRARALLIRAAVGKMYADSHGVTGDEPLNLIFNAIRSTIPNLIQKHGANKITTENMEHSNYAFLLSKALDVIDKRIELKDILSDNGYNVEYYKICFEIVKEFDDDNKTFPLFLMICKKVM